MSKPRGYFEEYLVSNVLDYLARSGQQLCEEAAQSTNTKEKTGNLIRSYFYLVCYNGVAYRFGDAQHLAKRSQAHKGLKGTGWIDTGADDWVSAFAEAADFAEILTKTAPKYRIHGFRSFDLFILNGAYYTEFLESGSYAKGLSKILGHPVEPKQWQVISQMRASCEALANAQPKGFKARVFKIGLNGDPFRPNNRS